MTQLLRDKVQAGRSLKKDSHKARICSIKQTYYKKTLFKFQLTSVFVSLAAIKLCVCKYFAPSRKSQSLQSGNASAGRIADIFSCPVVISLLARCIQRPFIAPSYLQATISE